VSEVRSPSQSLKQSQLTTSGDQISALLPRTKSSMRNVGSFCSESSAVARSISLLLPVIMATLTSSFPHITLQPLLIEYSNYFLYRAEIPYHCRGSNDTAAHDGILFSVNSLHASSVCKCTRITSESQRIKEVETLACAKLPCLRKMIDACSYRDLRSRSRR